MKKKIMKNGTLMKRICCCENSSFKINFRVQKYEKLNLK